jgi:PKD repeat protein
MDKQTSDHVIVGLFNYGSALENLWVTYNAGQDWEAIEGDLPDLPIRWAIFDPADHDRAMIATDAGIWTTDDINGDDTHWTPSNPDNGMPFVRIDMLVMRDSDKVVLAGTYGRGLMTTDIFSSPAPVIVAQPIAYEGKSLEFDGSQSVNAQSYHWDLGDNTTSTNAKFNHAYTTPGVYTVSLTINGSLTQTRTVSVLPYLPAPYENGEPNYAGHFESNPEHFASYLVQGTGFQRGLSDKPGKDGTKSGVNAWVLGPNVNLYQNNTRAELYTPMYDLSETGLYELKFWSKFAIQNRNDGFQIEYSIDAGKTWLQLGNNTDPHWYNYLNSNLVDGAFPVGRAYFTNAQLAWTQYIKDVSFLVGKPEVAFRFVFRSDDEEQAQGLAIDDFEVTKYDGELVTRVTEFTADYTGDQTITLNWTTAIEYQCQKFFVERSTTGFGFSEVGQVNAKGVVSTFPNMYETVDQSLRNVIYYRLRVVNDNPNIGYHHEFYTDTIVVRRDIAPNTVFNVLTNPFQDKIYVSFSSHMNQPITARLYDAAGKLIVEETITPNGIAYVMDRLHVPPGVYVFTMQIGEEDPKAYKLLSL